MIHEKIHKKEFLETIKKGMKKGVHKMPDGKTMPNSKMKHK